MFALSAAKTLPILSGILKTRRALTKADGKNMTRAAGEQNLDKVSNLSDSTINSVLSVSNKEMHEHHLSLKGKGGHSAAEPSGFLDFGKNDPYKMSDKQPDWGKAVQDWAGSVVEAGKHVLEGLGMEKAPPKAALPEQPEPQEKIIPFNPKIHGTVGHHWTSEQFGKWIDQHQNDETLIFWPLHDEPFPDCDPGFKLPMDKKGAPEIDKGFMIPSGRTTRKIDKDDDVKAGLAPGKKDDDAIGSVLAGLH